MGCGSSKATDVVVPAQSDGEPATVTTTVTASVTANETTSVTANKTASVTTSVTASKTASKTASVTANETASVTANETASGKRDVSTRADTGRESKIIAQTMKPHLLWERG